MEVRITGNFTSRDLAHIGQVIAEAERAGFDAFRVYTLWSKDGTNVEFWGSRNADEVKKSAAVMRRGERFGIESISETVVADLRKLSAAAGLPSEAIEP